MIYYLPWTLLAFLFSPIFYQLYSSRWEKIDYTHAYFILPFSLWILWKERATLKKHFDPSKLKGSDAFGLLPFAFGILMFIFGWRQEYLFVSTLSLLLIVWGMTQFLYGNDVLRRVRFPMLYLLFLIPPPTGILDKITIPMRYAISQATEVILGLGRYPIDRQGLLLTIGGNDIFMGAPCSGFRSLITMIALAVAYVYFVKGDTWKKTLLIISALPFALFGNLVRVISLCLVSFYFGKEAAEGTYHDLSGAVIFLIMIICLMGFENLLDKFQKKTPVAK